MMKYLFFCCLFFIGCNEIPHQIIRPDFPLAKGNQWTYEAHIRYHDRATDSLIEKDLEWVMEVTELIPHGNTKAAIVKGFPTDLVWYEGKAERANYLLLVDSNKIFLSNLAPEDSLNIRVHDSKDALTNIKTGYNLMVDFPLVKGKTWGADPEMPQRADSMYAWVVQNTASTTQAAGIKYNTNPDHSIFEIQPGVGITGYQFVHHGTVMELTMKLKSQRLQ
jgi:hypothetical protein